MTENKLKIAILSDANIQGGVYNILPSFPKGLYEAFKEFDSLETDYILNYLNKGDIFNLGIVFNVHGYQLWEDILNYNIPLIEWTVDSYFYKNFESFEKYRTNSNFHVFGVGKSDIEPLKYFLPEFTNFHYMPHGTDPKIWNYNGEEKDFDIVYLASIQDPQKMIKLSEEYLPKNLFTIFMSVFSELKKSPHTNIWDIYKSCMIEKGIGDKKSNLLMYRFIIENLSYAYSYQQRINMLDSLKDLGVKVWGNKECEKYISGKNKYMGEANIEDAARILPRSKVSIHIQPIQILEGLHERVLNSIMSESCVLTDSAPEIKNTFKETLTYYNLKDFSDIKEKALNLLNDKDLREEKAKKAKEIVLANHTWKSRAKQIEKMLLKV